MIRRAGGGGLAVIALVLIVVPILEVFGLIQVGRAIGPLPTIAILVAEAIFGAWLVKREGNRAWQALSGAMNRGAMPSRQLADAALVLLGGALFMMPGFFTDLVGLVCLIPFTRAIPRRLIAWIARRQAGRNGIDLRVPRGGGNVIPGVVVDGVVDDAPGRDPRRSDPDATDPPAIEGRVLD
ncbi:FxsA family protein [Aestuariimicrobium ganziense]|uniref:FxsA family protein n=1 Tax=Aestuariimicrobium ganziense TaxID=2773677 RepID=UPI001943A7C0|nr:FxsA family protein [Aestuariimicrobium ganziense]